MMNTTKNSQNVQYERAEYPVLVRFMELKPDYKNSEAETYCYGDIVAVIVNNGGLRVISDKNTYALDAGQGIMINSNIPFKFHLASNEPCGFYSIAFNVKYILPEPELYDLYAQKVLNDTKGKMLKITEDTIREETILDELNRIIVANLVKKSGYEIVTRSLLCNLWMSVIEYISMDKVAFSGRNVPTSDERRVDIAIKYISENYGEMISLDDIADHIHLSSSECCRCFKRVLFKSPMEYLMEYRVFSAVRILYKNPEAADSISELSFLSGFNNPSYFNKIFKRFMQCTPTQYRKMMKENPEMAERLYINMQEGITVI